MATEHTTESRRATWYRVLIFSMLMLTWCIFSGLFDGFHLSLGVISCAFVTWISSKLLFENRTTSMGARIGQAWRMCGYLIWLLWQILLANIQVLKLAFGSQDQIQPQIVRYDTALETDFEKFLLANSITLTPGTVTMKILDSRFYVHAISDEAAKGLDGEMERRIRAVFNPNAEEVEREATS